MKTITLWTREVLDAGGKVYCTADRQYKRIQTVRQTGKTRNEVFGSRTSYPRIVETREQVVTLVDC